MLRTTHSWPLLVRLAVTGAALAATWIIQIPIEREVPGEPFLPFFLIVIASTLAFGANVGFASVALSTVLSLLFFAPAGTFALEHASDLVKIEVYAILAAGSVVAFAHLSQALAAARNKADALGQLEESRLILLRELAHGVANNFASVAALLSLKSNSVSDSKAKSILDDAIEQVRVMGRVHGRLRAGGHDVSLDSQSFMRDLCDDLAASIARGRPIAIECRADSHPLCASQAVPLGLIVNELVTNAVKHAFPNGRAGRIRVDFEALEDGLHLCVEDDGAGFGGRTQPKSGMGRDLVDGLSRELGGDLEIQTTRNGSSFRLSFPYRSPDTSTRTAAGSALPSQSSARTPVSAPSTRALP